MIGLVILIVGAIYLTLLVWVTRSAYRWAKAKGLSKAKCWFAAAGGFLVVYLPVFWDHIPTVIAHQYYCGTEAGFWVYKTPEQWKKENPGVTETLVATKGASSARQGDMQNYTDTYFLNQRFNWIVKHNGQLLLNRWRHEQEIIDVKTQDVLAKYVDFSTSQIRRQADWSGWKVWIDSEHCRSGKKNEGRLGELMLKAKNLSKENSK